MINLHLSLLPIAYGPDSRPPMAIFELLDYIVNEVSVLTALTHPDMSSVLWIVLILLPEHGSCEM